MNTQVNLREMLPKDLIAPPWLATYERNIDAIWGQLVTLNSSIFVLEKISPFRFDLFVIGRKHFWDLVEHALVETCVLVIWRIGVDCHEEGLTLQQLKHCVQNNLLPQYTAAFNELAKTSWLPQKVSRIEPKIKEIRDNYIAHFNLTKHVKPTSEVVGARSLLLSELKGFRDTLNSYFELLCFGHGRAMLPIEYWPDEKRPASFECDVEELLDGVARNSDWLNLPENHPELWAVHKPEQSEKDLRILNQYRTKFGLPPA
jgi:hypothetical protein